MTFLHPAFLFGLAGAAIPVLIHLLGRRRARRVPFPSLRLLHAAQKKRRSLSRLQRLLSLLLRVLAVVLLTLGLSSPVLGPAPAWLPLPRPHAVALVLDDSLSMAYADRTKPAGSSFDRARGAASNVLSALGPGDRVALIVTSSPGDARWRAPSAVRPALPALRPTAVGSRLAPALLSAARALKQTSAPNRTVAVLADLQAAAWREPPVNGAELASVGVLVVDVGDERAENLSVNAVGSLTTVPLVGRPVRLETTVAASAADPRRVRRREVVAQFLVGGKTLAAAQAVVAPGGGGQATLQFSLLPDAPGDLATKVALAGSSDGLPEDDVRFATVRVRPALKVLIAAPGGPARGPGFTLTTALNPFGAQARAGVAPEVVDPGALAPSLKRATWEVVIVADCGRLDAASQQGLTDHLQAGGGVLLFLGDDIDAEYLGRQLLPALTGDAGTTLGQPVTAPPTGPLALAEINTSREPLSPFANPRAGDLGALRFSRARALQVGPKAEVLAAFDSGTPALVEWQPGRGRVILFNTSADGAWGEHVRSPAYVPLLHLVCQHLARTDRPTIRDVTAGEQPAITGARELPPQVTLTRPDGRTETAPVKDGLLPKVNEPGGYRAQWGDHEARFAVNVDARESDLTRTTQAEVTRALAPARVVFIRPDAAAELRAALPSRIDLSWPLIALSLALLLFESVFSLVRPGTGADHQGTT